MKNLLFLLLITIAFFSCDNSLDLNADWKDIPIVYGLLSATEEAQFIRVEKAFLDPTRPAPEIALIPDSIYYKNLKVSLLDLGTNQSYDLEEINGEDFGLPREEGAFANIPNILYRIDSDVLKIKPGSSYELQIDRGESKEIVRASTTVIDSVLISLPGTRVNFNYTSNFRIQWFPKTTGNDPSIYDAGLLINYTEQMINDLEAPILNKSVFWLVGRNISETEILKMGKEFYVFLGNNIAEDSDVRRQFKGIDVVVDAGGEEILDYTRVGQANLGITASQEIPFYTNLSEGRGIFSSRNRKIKKGVLLTTLSKDSLVDGEFTKQLNFIR